MTSNTATATVVTAAAPALTLLKTATPAYVTTAGQTVTYTYLITNTGNTVLTGIGATDITFSGTGRRPVITCPVTTLAPQQSTTCTGTYRVTRAEIAAGSIVNTAFASGIAPNGRRITSDPSTATVEATAGPVVRVVRPGTVVVANNGNTTLTDIDVNQGGRNGSLTHSTHSTISCPATTLAPRQSMTCTTIGARHSHRSRVHHRRHARHEHHRRARRH
ncbi:MAG: DUF7507 domain-containing protein [Actinoallomurus sp.]